MAISRIGVAAFQASMTRPVWPIRPRPQIVLSAAVSIGMSMPCRLRNETSSMSAMTTKVSGMRMPISRDCSTSVSATIGSPAK